MVRSYALHIRQGNRWVRVFDWDTGRIWPSFLKQDAVKMFQNILSAPVMQGWDSEFSLRPVKRNL